VRNLARKIFGSANERTLKRMRPIVDRINRLEAEISPLDQAGMQRRVAELRDRHAKGESLDDLLPEAFGLVREAAKRTLGQRHYDVQLIGGMVLHEGNIAEMKTGEGKTLSCTLPAFLNALTGRGVHVVTVNDFLARRDAEWMGGVHKYLGLNVGCIVHGLTDDQRRVAYGADITYGQNNEFGFDYLRDNMKPTLAMYVQREHYFAIVDEVDSILIDEARTPLIIAGPVNDDPSKFRRIDVIIPKLEAEAHYTVEEKHRQVMLTDEGVAAAEKLLGIDNLYAPEMMETLHVVQNALRAHVIYKRDVDYVVKDGQVVIVDEFTGRLMEGRRWSDGLHQAVEAKEQVQIQNESQTYASITFQNYFRMYEKLSGMTGTADTEAQEFSKTYDLDVVVVPTNMPMVRKDLDDVVYRSRAEKWSAAVDEVAERHAQGQPVLVGTVAIETSELFSKRLKNRGIPHNVLNAKNHAREAEIIAQAGRKGAVTISTNMAGRGTDIVLGGNAAMTLKARGLDPEAPENREELEQLRRQYSAEREDVLKAGGLFVLGTERHESRRIDNQLRGRSGRQGDAGASRFYLSLEDDLLRIFGSERIKGIMSSLGMQEGEAIEARMLSRQIEKAQAKVEARNFDMRKHLLEYDDVMNKQRVAIYDWRRRTLGAESLYDEYRGMSEELVLEIIATYAPQKGEADVEGMRRHVEAQFGVTFDANAAPFKPDGGQVDDEAVRERLLALVQERLDAQVAMCAEYGSRFPEARHISFDFFARGILLATLDDLWRDHLLGMDHLKEGIGLLGYGGKDPKREYQSEGFKLFEQMYHRIGERACEQLFRMRLVDPSEERLREQRVQEEMRRRRDEQLRAQHAASAAAAAAQARAQAGPVVRNEPKVGRNDDCPCGSGRKYKRCHGAPA
jgi:preprotein translocase subunit SecA